MSRHGHDHRSDSWKRYYEGVHSGGGDRQDYPGARPQTEALAVALKLAGDLDGAEVLDAGTGRGHFAMMALTMGAATVDAFDFSEELIAGNEARWGTMGEQIAWHVADLTDSGSWPEPDRSFDLVSCVEALHSVPTTKALRDLWQRVRPGGRLVAVFSNAESGHYTPDQWNNGAQPFGLSPIAVANAILVMGGVASWRCYALHFADDQRAECFETLQMGDLGSLPPYSLALVAVRE